MLKFEFTVEEVNAILSALAKMPYEVSAQLIGKIQQTGSAQMQQQPAEKDDE